MHPAAASALRLLIALAMLFSVAARLPAGDCAAQTPIRKCVCCKNPAAPSCCAAPENGAPSQQPAAPIPRASLEGQPAALPHRIALVVLPPVTVILFPEEKNAPRTTAACRSFQSVSCMWTV